MIEKHSLTIKKVIAHLWALIVLALMIMRPPSEMSDFSIRGLDKIAHFGVFGLMAFLYALAYVPSSKKSLPWLVMLSVAFYGIILECLQSLSFTQRDFDIFDIIANIIGALAGGLFYSIYKSKMYE